MHLGFHYHIPFFKKNNKFFLPGYLGRFLDELASKCTKLTCFFHEALDEEKDKMDYMIKSKNVHFVALKKHSKVYLRTIFWRYFLSDVKKNSSEIDFMLLRGPSPLLPFFKNVIDGPVGFLIVGNYLNGINDLPQPFWRKFLIGKWSEYNFKKQNNFMLKKLVLVNSHELYKSNKHITPFIEKVKTTTLTRNDFFKREDTCIKSNINLLFCGRIDRAKGIFKIIDAIALLKKQKIKITLNIVGWASKNDTIIKELNEHILNKSVVKHVIFHGYIPLGEKLFNFYKTADIFILASTHEGFPRSIWEAMAHSLPVISTKVGSIPYELKHEENAILIDNNKVEFITRAITNIINDEYLRKKIIKNGYLLAEKNTIEYQTQVLYNHIKKYYDKL